MSLQDRRPDFIQQRRTAGAPTRLNQFGVLRRALLTGHHLIEHHVPDISGAGPLASFCASQSAYSDLLVSWQRPNRTERIRMIDAASISGAIYQVHFVTGLRIIVGPTGSPITTSHVVQ